MNILNVGNTSRRYLSCEKSGTGVDLYTKDDGSMRQQWMFVFGNITLVGGNTYFKPLPGMLSFIYLYPNSFTGETYPELSIVSPNSSFFHSYEILDDGSCYIYRFPKTSSESKVYLQSVYENWVPI